MSHCYHLKLILALMMFLYPLSAETIWSEDFNDPGDDGLGAVGPTPTITEPGDGSWTVDVSSGLLTADTDWFKVTNSLMEARDVDGECLWISQSIDISGHTDVGISVSLTEDGDHEGTDYLCVYYKLDGGSQTEFETNGCNTDDFVSATATQTGLSGSTLQVIVAAINNADAELLRFDDVVVTGTPIGAVQDPSDFAIEYTTDTQISLTWTAPGGTYDNVLIFGRSGAEVDHSVTGAGSGYDDASSTWSSAGIYDNSRLVYSGTGIGVTILGLSSGTDYYFQAFAYDDSEWSSGTSHINDVAEIQGVSDFDGTAASGSADLTWTNYSGAQGTWWDEILILARADGTAAATPSGDGTGYSADTAFGSGTEVGTENYVVYKGIGNSVSVTNLTSGYSYDFQAFVRRGSNWTTGNQIAATAVTLVSLLITEVADPANTAYARFVELYNSGNNLVDFSSSAFYLSRQANGSTWSDLQLSGTVEAGDSYVVAYSEATFESSFGYTADQSSGIVTGNGNDGYFLYKDGDHTAGTLVDSYGALDTDGTGEAWEYTDSHAIRKVAITSPNTSWTASEWIINSADTDDTSPGLHPSSTWQGSDSDWTNGSNWDNGIPGGTTGALIPSTATNPIIAGAVTVRDLKMIGGDLTFSGTGTLRITRSINMIDGIITTNTTNTITLSPASTSLNGTSTSYVNGPMDKEFDADNHADFTFPVGKSADIGKCSVDPDAGSATFRAEYYNTGFGDYTHQSALNGVCNTMYWQITRPSGSTDALVTLTWDTDITNAWTETGPGGGNVNYIGVAKWYDSDNDYWAANGGNGSGTLTSGSTQSGLVDTFDSSQDYFTLGAGDEVLALDDPVSLKPFSILNTYPNPFNPDLTIQYNLVTPSAVDISIYNLHGQLIRSWSVSNQIPGSHSLIWHADNQPTGIYLVKISTECQTDFRKVLLLK